MVTDAAPTSLPALGICLEEYEYPYPVRFLPLSNDLQSVAMAYMDIPPGTEPNGKTVVLIHGKAFPRATRVVIPDCGHIPHLEHPSQFLADLLPFLAS